MLWCAALYYMLPLCRGILYCACASCGELYMCCVGNVVVRYAVFVLYCTTLFAVVLFCDVSEHAVLYCGVLCRVVMCCAVVYC